MRESKCNAQYETDVHEEVHENGCKDVHENVHEYVRANAHGKAHENVPKDCEDN